MFTCCYKHAAHTITCTPIKPDNIINMKCDLGFCEKFTNYIITDEELDDVPNAQLIHYNVYTNTWMHEEDYDIKYNIIKRQTYENKGHLTKISCSISEFHMLHYQPTLKKYAYNRTFMCLLGKH